MMVQPLMNLPNQLTVSRFVLTGLFLGAMFGRFPGHESVALVFFSLAGITDFLDGRIARQRGLITNFGILMDPLADKILRGEVRDGTTVTVDEGDGALDLQVG